MSLLLSIVFMIAALFAFACGSILTKLLGNAFLGHGVHPLQIAHSRLFCFCNFIFFYNLN